MTPRHIIALWGDKMISIEIVMIKTEIGMERRKTRHQNLGRRARQLDIKFVKWEGEIIKELNHFYGR